MPGLKYYARYDWNAILPGPYGYWNHRIPVFGLDSGDLSGNTSSPGPEPAVNSYHITRPDPPTHRAFQPAGAFPAGTPTNHGTFGYSGTFPSSVPAGYNTFQPPGPFHTGFPAGHGAFGSQGIFPPGSPAGYNTFQPAGPFQPPGQFHTGFPTGHGTFEHPGTFQPPWTFHNGFHTNHGAFGPQGTFLASGPIGYSTFQPPRVFPVSDPNGHDNFQRPKTFPAGALTDHRVVEATGGLRTHDPASHRGPETTEQVSASAPTNSRPVEPADNTPASAAIDHGIPEPTSSHTDANTSHRAIESAGDSAAQPLTDHRSRKVGPAPARVFPAANSSSSGTRAVPSRALAKSLFADIQKAKTSEGARDVTRHQPLHRESKKPAAQPTSAPFRVGKPAPKRDRSPPTMMDAEEEVAHLSFSEKNAHKKQRVGKCGPMTYSSPPDAASSGEQESSDAHFTSNEKHQTYHSKSLQEDKDLLGSMSAIRRLGIEEMAIRERIQELSQSAHLRDSPSKSERDQYLQECAEVQRQSLQLFYRSAAGQETVEYNNNFNGFDSNFNDVDHGGSGMKCSLCQTIFHDQYGSKQNPTATDFKIVDDAATFLKHVLHHHSAYEPPVRCEEMLSIIERYPAFGKITFISSGCQFG